MTDQKHLQALVEETDEKIAALLKERFSLREQIMKEKMLLGESFYDGNREKNRIEKLTQDTDDDFSRHGLEEVFAHLGAIDRKQRYRLLTMSGSSGKLPFIQVDTLMDSENVRVVYQGTEGAYSHAALWKYFGEDVNSFHVRRFRDAMEAIAEGAADYAVLPIENSTAGIVGDNFDLLVDFENYIVGDVMIPCEHVLMGLPGASIDQISAVYSHQQALLQCEEYLEQHPGWSLVPYDNTALAARKIAEEGDITHAAIGSEFAAARYGLKILADHIYSDESNATRFLIVTNQRIFLPDAGRISICFELPHYSGSLYNILSHIIYNDLNMVKIESRPIQGKSWEYRFFIDFEGNLNEPSVRNALRGIRSEAINMKILGNY